MNTTTPRHARLLDEAASRSMPALTALARAGMAYASASARNQPLTAVAKAMFGNDGGPILRAAVEPHSTVDMTALGREMLARLLVEMAPASAAAAILAGALRLDGHRVSARVPLVTSRPTAAWISENEPIPVSEMAFSADHCAAGTLAAMTLATAELLAADGAESAVTELLRQAVAKTLDETMFADAAAAPPVPAGLLHGVAPIAGYPGGDGEAALEDVRRLVAAVSPVSGVPVLVARQERLVALRHRMPSLTLPTAASAYANADALIAVSPGAVATMLGEVDTSASNSATVHMDSVPLHISDSGIAAPVASAYQIDALAIRITLEVGWARRSSAAAAWVQGASW